MKKTILLILAILPIVLVIIIAFAGRILSSYQYIPVERVAFLDENGTTYNDQMIFTVDLGQHKSCNVKIYPELASNKKVTYSVADESICSIDENGTILGLKHGVTTVYVKTDDGGKVAKMNVLVTANVPIGIYLSHNELTMIEGEQFLLDVVVDLPVALDKRVNYTSSNPYVVTVDATGKLVAKSTGTATITATTVSGGLSATCTVTVVSGNLPVVFDFKGNDQIVQNDGMYILSTSTINLRDYLILGEGINMEDVKIKLVAGSAATLEDGTLNFSKAGIVTVRAYIGDESNPTAFTEIKIAHR